ncbi:MAG: flagella protein [Euryarchaeota archaeon]|nr:flagella protein [Euryarchaeota archaeon]
MLLETLPDSVEAYAMVHRWLGYLLQYMDHEELAKLLTYYEKIGWLSKNVREKLTDIAQGITASGKGTWQLPGRAHLTSLLFIAYLAGKEIPRELYEVNAYATEFTSNPESFISI